MSESAKSPVPAANSDELKPEAGTTNTGSITVSPAHPVSETSIQKPATESVSAQSIAAESSADAAPTTPSEVKGPEAEEEAAMDVPSRIRKQVEYYFSWKNVRRDVFLQEHIGKDAEGFVEIAVLLSFPKLKALSESPQVVLAALESSNTLVIREDALAIRAKEDLKAQLAALAEKAKEVLALGGRQFPNIHEAKKTFGAMLHRYEAGKEISEFDRPLLEDLLKYHQKADEKTGSGIKYFTVGTNPNYPGSSCFIIKRTDDTEVDFSYLKCLEEAFVGRQQDRKRKQDFEGGGKGKGRGRSGRGRGRGRGQGAKRGRH
eukprot:NODE_2947_length_1082_cov_39.154889_g2703_i0.p1 GENE.NODE_2947_length_1082_cov_39.154889_g2703_i0~~NODE_2947_length_1082_cov_39.154889_g2703_i0.p1  ORF type:complete len:318 (+),score=56.70 NODE_2947_length_1082_cov_39.154889_g2703_i0:68-1021(+)